MSESPDTEYTPTTAEVRERFIDGFPIDTWLISRDECGRDFDRFLAAHDAEVAAKALEDFADTLGVNVGDEDSDEWRGYRNGQRQALRTATARAAHIRERGE